MIGILLVMIGVIIGGDGSHSLPPSWGGGVGVDALGSGLHSDALLFGPLSLLGGVFTTLLVFNLSFSYKFLGKIIVRRKVMGALVILAGSTRSLIGSPNENDAIYTPAEEEMHLRNGGGT